MIYIKIKNINNSQFRSLATTYAYDMAERMRSNRSGVSGNAYDMIDGTETDPGCTSPCSVTDVAQQDAFEWNQLISQGVNVGGLPSGIGKVTGDGISFAITITWQEQDRDDTGGILTDSDFTLDVQI
jgi:type IV pilus assembly protein PilV